MTRDRPEPPINEHLVLPFRPRSRKPRRPDKTIVRDSGAASPVRDLSKYQRPQSRDDYAQRMQANVIVFAIACFLVIAGTWMLTAITHPHT